MSSGSELCIRPALMAELEQIEVMIAASSKSLAAMHYPAELVEDALENLLGVDSQLIEDGTYFVATLDERIVGSGGWSWRKTMFGSDVARNRDDRAADPDSEPAKIRAFFVHPDYSRLGVGSRILAHCEQQAIDRGFGRLELGATLSGVAFYEARGYQPGKRFDFEFAPGKTLAIVPMFKEVDST